LSECGHAAKRHFVSIDGSEFVCVSCAEGGRADWIEPNEHIHQFVGDNLKFMELQSKRKELLNE
jgi:hypothetical protein